MNAHPAVEVRPGRLSTHEIEANARASNLAVALLSQAESAARQALATGFRLCAVCRMRVAGTELCPHHTAARERVDSWASANRVWCEFVHGKWRARQPAKPTGQNPVAEESE